MASNLKLPTRQQLATFLPDQESIRLFEKLFKQAQESIDVITTLGSQINTILLAPSINVGSAAFYNVPSTLNAEEDELVTGADSRLTDSRNPSGSAGGELTGTYPNPLIRNEVQTFVANVTGGGTAISQNSNGYYIKLNHMVWFWIDYDIKLTAAAGSGVANVLINNLPIAPTKTVSGSVGAVNNAPAKHWLITTGTTSIKLLKDSGSSTPALTGADITGDFYIGLQGCYFA